ncbi:hypothetical protein DRO58_07680 [Candidatus Bathyarchaeota archaeon]|nr:MAG: hypothetical protein DRO58_07680 [Candidatus Bathyarchaeota archaeon]
MADGETQIVTFKVGQGEYGINVQQVREIVTFKSCTKIPRVPSFIEGLMNLRGQVVLVVNLREFLEISDEEAEDVGKEIIIIDTQESHIGFLVDQVFGVVRVSSKEIEPPPVATQNVLSGIYKRDGKLTMIMDANRVLSLLGDIIGKTEAKTEM